MHRARFGVLMMICSCVHDELGPAAEGPLGAQAVPVEVRDARIACGDAHRCLLERCTELAAVEDSLVAAGCAGDEQACTGATMATIRCISECASPLSAEAVCNDDPGSLVCESLTLAPQQLFERCDLGRAAGCEFAIPCDQWTPPADPGC